MRFEHDINQEYELEVWEDGS